MPSKKEEEDSTRKKDMNNKSKKNDLQKRVGLLFPISKIWNTMRRKNYARIISQKSSVTVAAVLEYLTAEVIELSGDITKDQNKKNRPNILRPRHINLGIRMDKELNELVGSKVIIPMSGVVPFIKESLSHKIKLYSKFIESQAEEEKENSGNEIEEVEISASDFGE
ncbi:hypothetical protein SteCoe_25404 [Stentor coeruleus]|uniref:Histone H2A n=1 Tax=Stentor coeruleus TaxID=5963 RepID=A0A1R2BF85_9CILI|nr:hypothetical protein SteCoe_25404 [Stentor coeruleus]